jgi:hypothetical protein
MKSNRVLRCVCMVTEEQLKRTWNNSKDSKRSTHPTASKEKSKSAIFSHDTTFRHKRTIPLQAKEIQMQKLFMCVTKGQNKKSSQEAMVLSDSDDSWSETDGVVPDRSRLSTRSMGSQYRGDTNIAGQSFKRTFVEHRYHDHYHDPLEENLPQDCSSEVHAKRQTRAPRGGVAVAFPEKLHDMLSRMDEEGTNNVISWQPHGRCFLIHKKKDFVHQVMTRYVFTMSMVLRCNVIEANK